MDRSTQFLSTAILVSALTACGGSGVSVNPVSQADVTTSTTSSVNTSTASVSQSDAVASTGQFLDSAVSGLYYETNTFNGFTDAAGGFSYVPGEYVRFYLGKTFLGEALAQAEVTPLDLLDVADDPDKLQNMLRILQTIDSDSDPSNGITISDAANDYLSQFVLPLNDPAVLFEAGEVVQDMIAAVTNGSGLKDAISSFEHFHETLLLSRRQTDETILLDLMGTTWNGSVRSSACDDVEAKMTMKFTPLGIVTTGHHSINEETCKPTGYGILFETYETSLTFGCANQCIDSDLNRVVIGRDDNSVITLAHQAGSDSILMTTVPEEGASSTLALKFKP